ncbi:hypothetical protein [Priestia megaterium]|uniref:hypothetical protein n=1 Tax=Priestia megaterium TaxID=1404 RepID=UPI002E1B8612|nr:hypothetical protein [Priestia megaterium]
MALCQSLNFETGVIAEQAYSRIENLSGTKKSLTFSLAIYLDQQAFSDGKESLKISFFTFSPSVEDSSPNFIKQGYEYLKTLPGFQDAIDVLEEGQSAG